MAGLELPFQRASSRAVLLDSKTTVTEAELVEFRSRLLRAYGEAGVGPGVVVASAFFESLLSVAVTAASMSRCTFAPLNRASRRIQFQDRFEALRPGAFVLLADDEANGAVDAAVEAGVAVVRIGWEPGMPLRDADISLERSGHAPAASFAPDVQLVLHTSGTTARPRMVPLTTANLETSLANMAAAFAITEADRSLSLMPLFHVHALVASVLLPLSQGGSVVCDGQYSAPAVLGLIRDLSPTYYSAVVAIHRSMNARLRDHPGELSAHDLRFVRSSSEALDAELQFELEARLGVPVLQGYAMTECTSQVTSNPLPPGVRKAGSVGPSVGPVVEVVDADGNRCRAGQTGRVVLSGPSVVAGYAGDDPGNDAFVDGRLHTGDLGHLDEDGYLYLTGRTTDLIRRGGETISPLAVEEALLQHACVERALVFPVPDTRLGQQVAALVVLGGDAGGVDEMALREHVYRRRPVFEVPRRIIFVDALPYGPTGKRQRSGVAERYGLRDLDDVGDNEAEPPATATERRILELWEEALVGTVPGVRHDLFAVGGDSLLAKQLLFAVQDAFAVEITLLEFFSALTIREQATLVDERLALVEEGSASGAVAAAPTTADTALEGDVAFPLSAAQERMWVMHEIEPGRTDYHIPLILELSGEVDGDRLEASLAAIVERHEPLRTAVIGLQGGRPMQQVGSGRDFGLEQLTASTDADVTTLLAEHGARRFDLGDDLKIRAALVQGPGRTALGVSIHHIAADGRSLQIVTRELRAAFDDDATPVAPPTLRYRDYVAHEDHLVSQPAWTSDLDAWVHRFDPLPERLALPYDVMPQAAAGARGGAYPLELEAIEAAAFQRLTRVSQATPFMVMLAAKARMLSELTGATDIVIGTPSEDRPWPPAGNLVGLFVNTLPLRIDLSGDPSFVELIRRCRHVALQAYQLGHVQYDRIVEAVNPPRSSEHPPLFQVMLALGGNRGWSIPMGDAVARPASIAPTGSKFDLSTTVSVDAQGLSGGLEYDASRFSASTAARIADEFVATLSRGVAEVEGS